MPRVFTVALCALATVACSHQPMTAEESAQTMQVIQMNQHNWDQMNRNAAIIAAGARPSPPVNCLTSYADGIASTFCQ
jgi:hypothetical protein